VADHLARLARRVLGALRAPVPRRVGSLGCCLVGLFLDTACSDPSRPAFKPTATVREIMNSIIDPAADGLWDSVEIVATRDGTQKKAPSTDDDWSALRRHAIAVTEASNLLLIPGRQVARPGATAEDPRSDLNPEEVQVLMTQNPTSWTRFANQLHDAALESLAAIDARDVQQLLNAGDVLDKACESCHQVYWYRPAQNRPR
jgi:hypothetical protein